MNCSNLFSFVKAGKILIAVFTFLACISASTAQSRVANKSPNIILILADDLGFGDLSCYGATKFETPNFDQIAKKGIRFTDAHTGGAICQPSRYSMLTGRYYWRSNKAMESLKLRRLNGYFPPMLERERITLPDLLKKAGYSTAIIGKWHLGMTWQTIDGKMPDQSGKNIDYSKPFLDGPVENGFDYFFGIAGSADMPPYCFVENNKVVEMPSVLRGKTDVPKMCHEGMTSPGWKDNQLGKTLTAQALRYIVRAAQRGEKFFLYLPISAPHTPHTPAPEFKGKSGLSARTDMLLEADWTVGKISKMLDSLGLNESTLVIVTSDNGAITHGAPSWAVDPVNYAVQDDGHKANGYLLGQKGDIWEGGHRVPFIVSWPGFVKANQVSNQLICQTDLYATFAALVGHPVEKNNGEDSFSTLEILLNGGSGVKRSTIIHHGYQKNMFSIRLDTLKLINGQGSGGFLGPYTPDINALLPKGQLYNILRDPIEQNNLYDLYPHLVKKLTDEMDRITGQRQK